MSSRYNLRSLEDVSRIITQRRDAEYDDIDSDNEENYTNEESNTESEYDASEIEEIEDDDPVESVEDPDVPPPSKRLRSGSGLSAEQSSSASSKRGRRRSIVSGKNGHKWFTTPRERVTNRAPFGSFIPGPVGIAKEAKTAYETWNLFFDDVILSKILQHTNEEIHRYTEEREIDCTKDILYKPVDMIELKAFIGLMYFSGLQKTNMTSSDDLWDTKYGSIFYKATMSQKRFCTILRFLRYDDKATRPTRVVNDKFAAIRGIWEIFIEKCKTLYNPASYCTIDEQLLSFRGRCPFKVYNGSKPDKYGMKIVMLNDSRTFYMVNAIPYVGKVNTENEEKVPSYYIRKLSETLLGTNRNITYSQPQLLPCRHLNKLHAPHSSSFNKVATNVTHQPCSVADASQRRREWNKISSSDNSYINDNKQ
ncbi:piggyBac transposable element-derived protein 4-like [Anastrepha obliqua]|uniref:piggyBac transposable element-derived protein 4-like n=1 Tax=Anastrepha obliqua TaxID=95512 RepID=UPI00240A09AD|nr:piggyBac transposable element-derived protein 4-like [Anastrepha obliqua]